MGPFSAGCLGSSSASAVSCLGADALGSRWRCPSLPMPRHLAEGRARGDIGTVQASLGLEVTTSPISSPFRGLASLAQISQGSSQLPKNWWRERGWGRFCPNLAPGAVHNNCHMMLKDGGSRLNRRGPQSSRGGSWGVEGDGRGGCCSRNGLGSTDFFFSFSLAAWIPGRRSYFFPSPFPPLSCMCKFQFCF